MIVAFVLGFFAHWLAVSPIITQGALDSVKRERDSLKQGIKEAADQVATILKKLLEKSNENNSE